MRLIWKWLVGCYFCYSMFIMKASNEYNFDDTICFINENVIDAEP